MMSDYLRYGLSISRKNGLFLAAFLTVFFLAMRALGLAHEYYLRVFNALILILLIGRGILSYRSKLEDKHYGTFFDLYRISLRTAFIGVALFSVFLAIYLDQIDPAFMQEIQEVESPVPFMSPVMAAGIVFIEGFGSSLIFSYLVIQFLKKPTVEFNTEKA